MKRLLALLMILAFVTGTGIATNESMAPAAAAPSAKTLFAKKAPKVKKVKKAPAAATTAAPEPASACPATK